MTILVLPGDGIGPEITQATIAVLEAADRRFGLGLDFEHHDIGFAALEKHGTTLPDAVLERAAASAGILLGPISHLDYPARDRGGVNVSAAIRVKLDLYANVRPARTREGVPNVVGPFDLVIMRECTEGFYPDRNMYAGTGEFMPDKDMALSVRKITARACERIARRAFELARTRRKKVTAIHKANNFILSDGLFLREVRQVAAGFPDVELDEKIVDASAALLVRDPRQFDVICATNFHADILSDLASELSGGLGLAGSVNMNEELCCAQAQHGSAPDIAGQDRANPTSLILSAAMLLDWMGEHRGSERCRDAGRAIDRAVDAALASPRTRTADLGGALGTQAFAAEVARHLQ
jgi:isocitrate/isopropylmalate dehydrogenase